MTTALAVLVPAVFIAAIASRPPILEMDQLPVSRTMTGRAFPERLAEETGVRIDEATVTLRLLGTAAEPTRYAVEFDPDAGQAVNSADVLVYWTDSAGGDATVPDGAWLLGTLAGPQTRVFELPEQARPGSGRLIFYSLAQQRLIQQGWSLPTRSDTS